MNWLNQYYEKIREHIGGFFKNNCETELYEYVMKKTEPFKYVEYNPNHIHTNHGAKTSMNSLLTFLVVLFIKYFF